MGKGSCETLHVALLTFDHFEVARSAFGLASCALTFRGRSIKPRMRLLGCLLAAVACISPLLAQAADNAETFKYESDITRLRSLVIHSLYSHKDVFLRELLSNANDALEKLRITALTDREVMRSGEANVTIEVRLDEGGATGELVIRDTGIGMTKGEMARNLGTIARSGTSEFLKEAEQGGGADGNLIGQFGLGFYSCFLVSPTVRVSSLPPVTKGNPDPQQYTFVSTSSGDSFDIFPDPRGQTLGRGTEIVLSIGEGEKEFLSVTHLKSLMYVLLSLYCERPCLRSAERSTRSTRPRSQSTLWSVAQSPFRHHRPRALSRMETRTSSMTIWIRTSRLPEKTPSKRCLRRHGSG